MKPFLVLQLRPETDASDGEYEALIDKGGLERSETHRIRLDRDPIPADLSLDDYAGVIVGGGPGCVSDPDDTKSDMDKRIEDAIFGLMPEITDRDIPYMGCCYGIGILAAHLGAPVGKDRYSEPISAVECQVTDAGRTDPLLAGLPDDFLAFVGHKEAVQALPEGCAHLLASNSCPFQMIRHKDNVYATQFHPEADGAVFEQRIRIYKDHGYFDPADADRLIADCHAQSVTMPERILRRFVERYR
ncbi:MAG: glutamine amidotransferase [Roseitalea sp.]|nr:glutamine amidotransferase [Roseitalea sp.]MBO6952725.1 glutamine amidotransferase [Rhizobiaceae bacterium]MBO6592788.1 glutamine amidotransferase [Roseitalea sp.]MBO6600469.1 glutamine amidotransferase [Roseitalea sp.]MBO6612989.1 glutamine amidotransferase [Roseitalea sp.]